MYTCHCRRCGVPFQSSNYNSNYCSHACVNNDQFDMQRQREHEEYNRNRLNSGSSHNYSGGGGGVPAEVLILGGVAAAAWAAWESIKNWQTFEPVTRHILHLFYYIFYKPLHFSTNIHFYFSKLELKHGTWMFFVKWGVVSFYVIFIFALYFVVIEMLNQKRLHWVWILFLLSPLITHGIWYFFIA